MREKRALAALLALVMVVGLLPMGALAAPAATAESDPVSVVGAHYSENENAYEIYPVPHSVTYPGGEFTMTDEVNVVVGTGVDTYTTNFLREILTRFGRTMSTAQVSGKTNIVLAIDSTMTESEGHYDPYTLTAQDGTITITGMDADCVYYGVATLQMMFTSFNAEKFLNVRIDDYSNSVFRGFIEGFYGGFDYDGRESQMRAIRDVKGNMYVFASKTDPYHGSNWSGQYPQGELNQIKHLVEVGKETKVNYTWSVHLGKGHTLDGIDNGTTIDETLYAERLRLLKAKFEQLYGVGVRSFNILNDDYNSGTYRVQVKLLNDVNAWLKEKGDCMPLIYCCAGYNTSWAGNGAEMTALAALDDDIYLYWTGSDVNSPITQTSVDWPADRAHQPVVTWLNYPCSEHCGGRGVFLGDISHYVKDADGLRGQYGLLSNAISLPAANLVAYFQLLSWCWNRDSYSTYMTELWEDSFKYLQPEVYEAYLTIARNVSNCPGSGRIPNGFPESEYIKDALATVKTGLLSGDPLADIEGSQDLMDELDHILDAITDFRDNCSNDELQRELEPWLKSLASVATAAKKGMEAADAVAMGDVSGAWNAFSEGAVALGQWDANPSSNPNVSDNVKAGSLRLQPFANEVLGYVEGAMARRFSPDGIEGAQSFYAVLHGVERQDDANSAKIFDGNPTTFASYQDGTGNQQQADDYYGVDLGTVKQISAVDILQGSSDTDNDYFHKAALEYSANGHNWTTLVSKVNSRHIHVDGLDVAARYVRLRLLEKGYGSKNDFWTHIREFTVTEKAAELLYTNVDDVEAQEDSFVGTHTLTIANATLSGGDYVGIQFPQLTGIQSVSTAGTLPAGVVLEWSVNGETWTADTPAVTTLMGYVRLRATAAATLENVTLTASGPVETILSFVRSNVGVSAGAWTNVVDGDRNTLVHTNTKQEYGQYAIFDLSGKQPIHDITVWIPESGNDIPHNLDIFVGDTPDPDGQWERVAQTLDNHYDMDVPHRYFRCDAEGVLGRYIKLAIANVDAANWFRINELEVNTTVRQEEPLRAVSATSGDARNAADGDLLTFLIPDANAAGAWTKLLQAPAVLTGVTVLRGEGGATAAVEVQKNGAWKKMGTLTQSATTVSLSQEGAITGVRVTWTAEDVPAIAEVIFQETGNSAGMGGVLYPNIYEQPTATVAAVTVANGTPIENIPLPDSVTVTTSADKTVSAPVTWSCDDYVATTAGTYTFTGTPGSETLTNPGCFTLTASVTVKPAAGSEPEPTPEEGELISSTSSVWASGRETASFPTTNAVDNDENSRWSSNLITSGGANSKTDHGDAWIVVDLGENVASITSVAMSYYNLVWPKNYLIQVAGPTFTPTDYSEANQGKNGDASDIAAGTFTGVNAKDDSSTWTTIKTISNAAYNAHPDVTIDSFDRAIPDNVRYLRLYFIDLNPAAGGNAIGLEELTVTGTRSAAALPEEDLEPEPNSNVDTLKVWASGTENSSTQHRGKAVDNDTSTQWNSNYMKNGQNTNAQDLGAAWIIVDLGEGVKTISSVQMSFFNLIWPTAYKIQVNNTDITPVDYSANGTKAQNDANVAAGTYSGINAEGADCWTDLKTVTGASYNSNPVVTIDSFDAALPVGTRYLRVYFKTLNHAAAGNGVGLKELTVRGTRTPVAATPNVTSVAPLTAAGVLGDAFTDLTLPTHAIATLADGTTVRLPVSWSDTGYNADSASQTLTGALTLPGDGSVTNTGNVAASLTLTLAAPPTAEGWLLTPEQVSAKMGTPFAQLTLPAQAVVQLSNGSTVTLDVTWDAASYNANTLGDQDVSGTVTLPRGGTYTGTIVVTLTPVLSNQVTLNKTAATLYTNAGEGHTVALSATVEPSNAGDKAVNWRSSNTAVAAVNSDGLVTATGIGTATITAFAHDGSGASATCEITVMTKLEGSVVIVTDGKDNAAALEAEATVSLANLIPGGAKRWLQCQWNLDGAPIDGATGWSYTPGETDVDKTLTVTVTPYQGGDYTGSVTSAGVTVEKAAGPVIPAGKLSGAAPSATDASDGAITGFDADVVYEYKAENASDWTELTGVTTTGAILAAGNYQVRVAATATHAPGAARTVTVPAYNTTYYTITVTVTGEGPHGSVDVADQAAGNETVTVTVTPDTGYKLGEISVVVPNEGGEDEEVDVSLVNEENEDGPFTFEMPAADVTVTVTFAPKTITIHHELENITCSLGAVGESHTHTITYGDAATIKLTPATAGYKLPANITVKKADGSAFSGYEYDPDTGTLTFTHLIDEDVTITGTAVPKSYTIEHDLTDLDCDMGAEEEHKVNHGAALTIRLTAPTGYHLPDAKAVTIRMGGEIFTDYTYTRTTETQGTILIAEGKITGDLVISAAGVKDPTPLTSVSISGMAKVGRSLTAVVRPSTATVTYQWFRGDDEIAGATGSRYTLTAADTDQLIRVKVTANGEYSGELTSEPTDPVAPGDVLAVPVTGVALNKTSATVEVGKTLTLTATVTPADATDGSVSWTSSDETVATVDENGLVTGVAVGTATITATTADGGLTATCAITVRTPSSSTGSGSTRPSTTPTTETKEDGTKVTTETKPDGTKVETVEEPDGTKAVTETKPDGSKTATVEQPDGTKAVTETKPDGSKTATVEQPDGTKSETVVTAEGEATVTVTDPEGEVLAEVSIPAEIPEPETKFEDLDKTPWAEEAINKVAGLELVKGVGGNKYDPVTPMTRGALATVLHRLSNGKTDYEVAFKDVFQNKYYTEGVAWAAKTNVVKGISQDIFAPDEIITREQLAVMLARYAKLIGMSTKADTKALEAFNDGDTTGTWAVDGMAWAVSNGILKGKGANNLDPTASVSRAEVAVMLDRFIALIQK